MKKTLVLITIASFALPFIAAADTVWVLSESDVDFGEGFTKQTSKSEWAVRRSRHLPSGQLPKPLG